MIIDKNGPDGNAYVIMGNVQRLLKQIGQSQEDIDAAMEKMQSGDYDNLCAVAEEVTNGTIKVR